MSQRIFNNLTQPNVDRKHQIIDLNQVTIPEWVSII
jgi:hypothetical protein